MNPVSNISNIVDDEMFLISLNRRIPLQHLNLIYCLYSRLDELISTKYDDISNMVQLTYGIKYDGVYAGFENFCDAYNDTVTSILLQRFHKNDVEIKDQPMLERRLFENIWLIYSTSLLKFFLSATDEIGIPHHISSREERNNFFTDQLPQLERDFILYWSNHLSKFDCGSQCCKAIVIDGFQKPDRFVCNFMQELVHSEELGDIEWGCGFRPEMVRDKQNP
ncbi:unnamed protein product, partial [Rotaria sp. Silwood1]